MKRQDLLCSCTSTLLLIAFLALVTSIVGCKDGSPGQARSSTTETTLQRIKRTNILKVGYVNFPPFVFKDVDTGKMRGHFILSVEEIAKQVGAKCQYTEATWSTFVAGLQTKQFDLSIAPTFGTIPRALSVAFSRPLIYAGNSAIVRAGETRFSSLEDIDKEGITVAVTQGEAGQEYAKANIKKAKVVVMSQGDQTLAFTQVLAKRADVALGDAYVTAKFAAEHHGEAVDLFANNPYNLTAICWAVRPDDLEFLNFVNTAIDVLDSTGKLAQHERAYDAHWLHPKRDWTYY